MSKPITLKEYEFLQSKDEDSYNEKAHYINQQIFLEIEKFVLENEASTTYLKLTTKKGFGKILQAQKYVGVIQTKDGTTIEIIPKVKNVDSVDESKAILLRMLRTLKKSPFNHLNKAHLKSSKLPLLEIFISMFLEELATLIRKGIKSQYILKEENIYFFKGKLKIGEQIKYNSIHKERFIVEYEEFLSDRVENKLIKTTLKFLYKKSRTNKNQQKIREFLFVFDDVTESHNVKLDFSKVNLNRQMSDYEEVLALSKIFLFENFFSPYKGNENTFALFFDMNYLFESYFGVYLKKKEFDFKSQDRGKYLVERPNKFALRPNFVVNKETFNETIIDTKYKNISSYKDINQADMYQLYAYGTKY